MFRCPNVKKVSLKRNDWLFRIALSINIGIALSYIGFGIIAIKQDLFWRADFTAFYTGGAIVRDGLGNKLYDFTLQTQYQQKLFGGRNFSEELLPFINPPHAALFLAPLTNYSRPAAFLIWTLFQASLLIWLMVLLWHFTDHWPSRERWLFLSSIPAFYPLFLNFLLGAFSLFTLNCLMLWIIKLKQKSDKIAGFWLAASSFKPQTIALPVFMLLFSRRWQALITATLGGMVIVIGSSISSGLSI